MTAGAPAIDIDDIALFLDVDGTVIEIAESPDSVIVPDGLKRTLQALASRENGALAFITGRTIETLDRLFAPLVFPVAGLHGLERRDAAGRIHRPAIDSGELDAARLVLTKLTMENRGLLLEDKGAGLALHYRLAPEREPIVRTFMTQLAAGLAGRFTLRTGKCIMELGPAGYSKGGAVEAFMREAPFAGRVPVFVGDDVTDEDGFKAVNDLNGYSIRVGSVDRSQARYRFDAVKDVVAWLEDRIRPPRT